MSASFNRYPKRNNNEKIITNSSKPTSSSSSSSFSPHNKEQYQKIILQGTKPWTNGMLLTSTGLRELDSILNNGHGQPLSSLIVIEEDRFLDYGSLIARYWCSEAIAQNHMVGCVMTKLSPLLQNEFSKTFYNNNSNITTEEVYEDTGISKEEIISFLQSLPLNLHKEKMKKNQKKIDDIDKGVGEEQINDNSLIERLQDTMIIEEEEEEEENNDGLNVAWQYHTSIQRERLGLPSSSKKQQQENTKSIYCHSYDLNQYPYQNKTIFPDENIHFIDLIKSHSGSVMSSSSHYEKSKSCYDTIMTYINNYLEENKKKQQVLRLLFLHPPSYILSILTSLMYYIKTHSLPIIILVIHRPWKIQNNNNNRHINILLQQTADVLLQVQGLSNQKSYTSSSSSSNYEALLQILKCYTDDNNYYYSNITKFVSNFTAYTYKMKLTSRKLELQMLHIPPAGEGEDDQSNNNSSGKIASSNSSGGGPRSVTRPACATTAIDF